MLLLHTPCERIVQRLMTDCLLLPEKADSLEDHSRYTASADNSVQMEKHTHTHTSNSYADAQVYPFISAS